MPGWVLPALHFALQPHFLVILFARLYVIAGGVQFVTEWFCQVAWLLRSALGQAAGVRAQQGEGILV